MLVFILVSGIELPRFASECDEVEEFATVWSGMCIAAVDNDEGIAISHCDVVVFGTEMWSVTRCGCC